MAGRVTRDRLDAMVRELDAAEKPTSGDGWVRVADAWPESLVAVAGMDGVYRPHILLESRLDVTGSGDLLDVCLYWRQWDAYETEDGPIPAGDGWSWVIPVAGGEWRIYEGGQVGAEARGLRPFNEVTDVERSIRVQSKLNVASLLLDQLSEPGNAGSPAEAAQAMRDALDWHEDGDNLNR